MSYILFPKNIQIKDNKSIYIDRNTVKDEESFSLLIPENKSDMVIQYLKIHRGFANATPSFDHGEDYVVGISTSGNSKNVVKAIEEANSIGAFTLGFTGKSGGKLLGICRNVFHADSDLTSIIQEIHITAIHMICSIIDVNY